MDLESNDKNCNVSHLFFVPGSLFDMNVVTQFMRFAASMVEKDQLEAKIASMRILDNVDLPASIQSLLPPKPVKKTVKAATNGVKAAVNGNGVEAANGVHEGKEEEVVPQRPAATVRMANLCVIAGHKVNGVAAIHSQIVIDEVFNDFYKVHVLMSNGN